MKEVMIRVHYSNSDKFKEYGFLSDGPHGCIDHDGDYIECSIDDTPENRAKYGIPLDATV